MPKSRLDNRYQKYKKIVMDKLGTTCKCCGINDPTLLSIDHINGGGHQASKNVRGRAILVQICNLSLTELSSIFQCLCFNCNYTKGFWGTCAHNLPIVDINLIDSELLLIANHGTKRPHLSKEQKHIRTLKLRKIERLKSKLQMIDAYGGKCIWCEEKQALFLSLDHINNNGAQENKRGFDFYQYLKRLGYPGKNTQLQLLCHNCNARKEYQNNRLYKSEKIKTEAEIYFPQNYCISEDTEKQLWHQARCLFYQLNNYSFAGISALNASVLLGSTSESAVSRSPAAKLL